ncbi:hypothetical protein XENORESO_002487 [Xenotaenia resolanae]|uniref:Uncharacterized protein n=1 Tax=Xenotaenia resolanae TaxID=208358 RepID=A0ABV0W254_9TELE
MMNIVERIKDKCFSNNSIDCKPLLLFKKIQNKLKLQAALKAPALQRNSACAATAGAWHRLLHATDDPATQFCTSPVGGSMSRLVPPLQHAQKLTILITFNPQCLNYILTKYEAGSSKSLGGVR